MNYLSQIGFQSLTITFFASILVWLLYLFLVFLWLFTPQIKKKVFLHAFFSGIVAWTLSQAVKYFIPAIRPFELNGFQILTLTVPQDASFPSGHSSLAFALAVSLWLHNKKIGAVYFLGALLVGLGRILGNVHFPIDILGGAVLGAFVALFTENFFNRKKPKFL